MTSGGITYEEVASYVETRLDNFTTVDMPPLGNSTELSEIAWQNATNGSAPRGVPLSGEIRIPLYCIIFVLAVLGNSLVIVTLVQNRRMRTVTNVFLLNLSVADLLLAVFCMPFTLIPTLLQNFIFGKAMCVLIRYMQGRGRDDYICKS